jgi:histidinol-phosphate aminotransferase
MSCDLIALATPGVQSLTPYLPGKPIDELERELGITNIIKLASNENPLGLSSAVKLVLNRSLDDLTRYPDGNGFELKRALADKLGVDTACITLGNGSNDVLDLLARAFLTPANEAIFSEYAFAVYPIAVQAAGAQAVVTPALDYGHDLDAMLAAITAQTRLIFIANPNNPTGTWLDQESLARFLAKVPENVLVVLDEAYFEYVQEPTYGSGLQWLETYPNLVVTRTFSKAWGLAGLRVGYSISHPQIANVLNRVRNPFNVNSLALCAATRVLADAEYLQASRHCNQKGMAQLETGFKRLGLPFIPSVGNFISVETGTHSASVYEQLLRRGVIVRPLAGYAMPCHLRVTIGTEEENQRFLVTLAAILSAATEQGGR